MKKDLILKISLIILACLISLLAVIPTQTAEKDRGAWMAELDDARMLNTLAIPGTHDSGATHSIADLSGKCQSLSIKEQLKLGVRFFDIRLQLKNNELVVVHSFVDQATDFSDVLADMSAFLNENPSEFLLVSIKEDADAVNSSLDFTKALEDMLLSCDNLSRDTTLPETVGEARGKMHIIARYSDATIGYPAYHGWADSTSFELGELYVQDHYRVSDDVEKKNDILVTMQTAERYEHALVLNFTSCYYPDGFPPTYAGTPALKINPWFTEFLKNNNGAAGVFVCDFMTRELCDAIIGGNFV